MAILAINKESEYNDGYLALLQQLNYIMRPEATNSTLTYGHYVSITHPLQEMLFCKQTVSTANVKSNMIDPMYGKLYIEHIISLVEEENYFLEKFIDCVREINIMFSNYNGGCYQVLSCIHTNTDNLHAHFIVNNTELKTGQRLSLSKAIMYDLRAKINDILAYYDFHSINGYHNEGE